MVVEINIIKGKTLRSYNREAIKMVVHLRIRLCPGKMVQLYPKNDSTIINRDILPIILFIFLLIMSVADATDVVQVHTLAKDPALERYRSALGFLITLMERFQDCGNSWIHVQPQVYAITKK